MQDLEFRRNCELRAMDEPVSNRQALEALDNIVKNPQRDAEDHRILNQAVSVLENFIYIHQDSISSMYWKNDEYPSCARILAHHHKIVTDAQIKIVELKEVHT